MYRLLTLVTALVLTTFAKAQTNDFATMKAQMSSTSIPLVNISVDETQLNKDNYISASIEIADPQQRTDGLADVTYACTVRYRGATSLVYDKKSFNIKLVDSAGADLNANVFGIRAENSWILDAMTIDRSRMRNRLCFDIWNDISSVPYETKYEQRNGTKGVHVELFINGTYHGLYCLGDKVDRKLLGLKKAKVEGTTTTTRGLLYKCNNWNSASSLLEYDNADVNAYEWNAWELQYPNDYANIDTWQPLMSLIDFCSDATTDANYEKNFNTWFYLDNLADFFTFTNALYVRDTGWKNTFLSTPNITEGHRYLISPWDMDTSLGGEYDGTYFEELVSLSRYDATAPFKRLRVLNLLGFNDLCKQKWTNLSGNLLNPASIEQRIDSVANMLTASGAWQREVEKWNGNPVMLEENISDELSYIKQWYADNFENINQQWNGTTGICMPDIKAAEADNVIYDLQGRRVGEMKDGKPFNVTVKKGVYIVGGKKIKL